ncbi:MAG: hypothetical protein ACM37W_26480 [Actinomycetota bacterium]
MAENTFIHVLSSGWTNLFNDDTQGNPIQCELADYIEKCPYCNRRTQTDPQGWYCHCGAYGDRYGTYNPKF